MPSITPVGIDLGTSYCAISWIDANGQSQMIRNDMGDFLTPSVVYFGEEQVAVGAKAVEAALKWPDHVAENVKRDIGGETFHLPINGQHYPPEVIQSCILRQLRRDIIAAVGEEFEAVITVPAYFDEARRKATVDAAHMSGLPVLDIVNEPTAAALSFGERLGYLTPDGAPNQCLNVLVYDLGGGTFDVSVIRMSAAEIRVLATDGDYELGGENWDQRLAECCESRFRLRWPNAPAASRLDDIQLKRLARAAKHALSTEQLALIDLSRGDCQLKVPMTREEFEELTADLLERTIFTTRQALGAAGLVWSEIDRVLLVGGSSRMPSVQRALQAASEIVADAAVNPDEAVARGAAIYARYLIAQRGEGDAVPKLRITDVNSHSLGIEGVNLETLLAENVSLIRRNSPLPREVTRSFVTRHDNQPNVKVQLLEGESSLPSHCNRLATATIKNLPPGLPKGTAIEVRYSLQSNGRLEVSASIPGHGANAQIELQRVHGLNDRRVQRWKKIVCRDGGFRDYHDAVASLLITAPEPDDAWDADFDFSTSDVRRTTTLDPAVDFGAPQAASHAIHDHFRATAARPAAQPQPTFAPRSYEQAEEPEFARSYSRPRKRRESSGWILGYIGGGLIGIAIGYYVLCLIRPDLNHLEIDLPGVRGASQPSPTK